ncbi:MAG: hypothetical protein Q8K02_09380, partial [Flavobacterium sp.]|nr:hypothetical protein [Flavobacterium sp.]
MRKLKALFDFYINASIHVAFAVAALVRVTQISLQLDTNQSVLGLVFFGTIVGYNFLKYFEAFQNGTFDLNTNRYLVGLTFFSLTATTFYFLQLNNAFQIYFVKVGLLVVTYPFLRKYGFWKLFLVSFCVTIITVYIPVLEQNIFLKSEKIILLQRFLIVVSLLIPFEILDSKTDAVSLKTIPQRFGIFRTKLFGVGLLIPIVLLEFFKDKFEISTV